MSGYYQTFLYCDSPSPRSCKWGGPYSSNLGHETLKEQRKLAKKLDGWKQVGTKDYCPYCQTEYSL